MRWLLALLAALVLASLGWSWLDAGDPAPPSAPGAADDLRPVAPPPPDRADGNLADASLGDGDLRPWAEELLDDDPGEERVDASADPADDGPVLLVVRGPGAEPVAGADVWFLAERELERRNAGSDEPISRIDGPETYGQRRRTGADGRVQLPRGRDRWLVAAQQEDEFGFAVASPRRREQVLTLVADERLVVTATFADEAPAQVPLSVLQQLGPDRVETIWRGSSDADGRAELRHFQLRRQDQPQRDAAADEPTFTEQFAVVANIPSQRAALTRFAGRPLQAEPVHVVVPALGQLEVTLVDHAGAPLLTPAMVFCGAEGQQDSGGFPLGWGTGRRADKPPGTAPVVLEPVAVGDALVAYARYPDERRMASAPAVRGPEQPGGRVQVRVAPREQQVVLAGRVLGPDRQPLPVTAGRERLRLVIWNGERVERVLDVRPVADGRFDLVTTGNGGDGPFRAELRATPSGDASAGPELGLVLPMPKWPGGLRVELGTYVMQPLPPLAVGVVIDDLGQPVADAQITVQQLVGTTADQDRRVLRNGGPFAANGWPQPPAQQPAEERWSDLPGLRTRSAPDGAFAIHGELPPGRLRVRADTDRHFADSVALAAANRTLQIRIARNGIVRGRVLLPDWLVEGAVSVVLQPLDEAQRQRNSRRADIGRRGGRFTLEPLHPGRYDCLVTMRGWQQPLLTIPDVFVQPGDNDDARLRVIDLREALFRYRLRAVDETTRPLPLDGPIRARLQQPDGSWTEAGFRWRNGRAELITAATLLSVQVFGRGIETLETQLLPGDHDLRLRTLRPALLDVPGARALCGPTRKVRVSVILQGDTGLPASFQGVDQRTGERFSLPRWDLGRSSGGWLGTSDVVEVPLMVAGKYEVLLRPHATDSTNSPQASVSLGVYELRPGGGEVTSVRVEAQAVIDALQRLDEQQQQREQQREGQQRRRGNGGGR